MILKTATKITLILLFCVRNLGFCQEADTVLNHTMELMDKGVYEVQVTYKLYKGEQGDKVFEEYSGIISRNRAHFYQQLGSMEYIQAETFFVKLNHEDKEIMIGEYNGPAAPAFPTPDISSLCEFYDIDKLSEDKHTYKYTLLPKPGTPSKTAKVTLEIDKKTFHVRKQTILLSTVSDFSIYGDDLPGNGFDIVRLEISYKGFKEVINKNIFNKERYFSRHNGEVRLGKEFKGFEYIPAN